VDIRYFTLAKLFQKTVADGPTRVKPAIASNQPPKEKKGGKGRGMSLIFSFSVLFSTLWVGSGSLITLKTLKARAGAARRVSRNSYFHEES
jgi:hypothetical protein